MEFKIATKISSRKKLKYEITEREWKSRAAPRTRPEKKKKPKLKKLERTHEKRGAELERMGYDPKSVEKFGGIVE